MIALAPVPPHSHARFLHEQDPLRWFEWKNERLSDIARHCGRLEIYVHSANLAGKTTAGAALTVALMRGLPELGGITLPRLPTPCSGALIVPSYKQASGSSIEMVRRMIGNRPCHEATISAGLDYVGAIYVKPDRSTADHYGDWSKLYIYPHEGEIPEGVRLDFIWADEPPKASLWRAARFRRRGTGSPFCAYITGTPKNRMDSAEGAGWWWLMEPDEFRDCIEPHKGRLRIQSSVYDNTALHPDDIAALESAAATDPHGRARLYGEHVDASGGCPYDAETLRRWLARCTPGTLETFTLIDEKDSAGGRLKATVQRTVEFWEEPDDAGAYLVVADTASGLARRENDPSGIHVWNMRKRKLVARFGQIGRIEDRWNGYLGSYGLGRLSAVLAARYKTDGRPSKIGVERGGWSQAFLTALSEVGHRNIMRASKPDRPGVLEVRLGFDNNEQTRPLFIASVERALLNDDAIVLSEDVVRCLGDCVLDEKGKILAGPGYHDEDLILMGAALHFIQARPMSERAEKSDTELWAEAVKRKTGIDLMRHRRRPLVGQDKWA